MITLVSSQKSPTPNISAPSVGFWSALYLEKNTFWQQFLMRTKIQRNIKEI
jgi:hypothetical protein